MTYQKALEAFNLTLQDLRNNQDIMGGVLLVLAGDIWQIFPVIPKSRDIYQTRACQNNNFKTKEWVG